VTPAFEFQHTGNRAGVYHLIRDNRVIYIGASVNVMHRVSDWMGPQNKPIDFDRVRVFIMPASAIEDAERDQLALYQPEHNTEGVSKEYRPHGCWGFFVRQESEAAA